MNQQDLSGDETQRLKNQLHVLRTACGCETGMVALLVSITLCVRYFGYAEGMMYSRQYKVVAGFLVCLVAAMAGKMLGRLWAWYRYRELKSMLTNKGIL